ncbi:unnamed protein product, partial [marine sediment metagenome]
SAQFIFDPDIAIHKLQEYHKLPIIACDIETKSLKPTETGVETIGFAKSPYEGFAIAVDRNDPVAAERIRQVLTAFFRKYKGKIIWHGGKFDRKIITNAYYKLHSSPMYRVNQHEDTIIMAYCCLNSVERPSYRLKDLSFEFYGDYGIDVKDTTKIPIDTLLDYNIHDACATFYQYLKYAAMLTLEGQWQIYREIFLPSLNTLIKTELHGIPVCPKETKKFIATLTYDQTKFINSIQSLKLVKDFTITLKQAKCDKRNSELKKKRVTLADFDHIVFNPGSGKQVQQL